MILKWVDFINETRNSEWFKRNSDRLVTNEVDIDYVISTGVPDKLIQHMRRWEVIMKSPLSNSYYSSRDTAYNHKPDGIFRCSSDHWNFISKSDGLVHCKTDINVVNNEEWCIGKYNLKNDNYEIILRDINKSSQR